MDCPNICQGSRFENFPCNSRQSLAGCRMAPGVEVKLLFWGITALIAEAEFKYTGIQIMTHVSATTTACEDLSIRLHLSSLQITLRNYFLRSAFLMFWSCRGLPLLRRNVSLLSSGQKRSISSHYHIVSAPVGNRIPVFRLVASDHSGSELMCVQCKAQHLLLIVVAETAVSMVTLRVAEVRLWCGVLLVLGFRILKPKFPYS